MKTFFYSISLLALLSSPLSCSIEEMSNENAQNVLRDGVGNAENATGIDSTIDPPIMNTKP